MKNVIIGAFLCVTMILSSCQKEESTRTVTTTSNVTTTKSEIKITVEDLYSNAQPNILVQMFDQEIELNQEITLILSATTNANGVATFNMTGIANDTPKTYYFGAFTMENGHQILKGSRKLENVKKNTEYKANLVLIYK